MFTFPHLVSSCIFTKKGYYPLAYKIFALIYKHSHSTICVYESRAAFPNNDESWHLRAFSTSYFVNVHHCFMHVSQKCTYLECT